MTFEQIWSGDWHGRILERVRERGFETLADYANDRTGVSLVSLAAELGPEDIAAAQLRTVLLEEATRRNEVPRLLRDLLVRELREALPLGWNHPLDESSRSRIGRLVARWWAELKDYLNDEMSLAASRDFLEMEPPEGWLPEGPDDPVIIAFVDRCLGRPPS